MAALEALLFIHGEPLAFKKIQAILALQTPEEVSALVLEFKKRLDSADRGLAVILDGEKVQLVTKSTFGSLVESFVKEELSEDLTPASVEALAVISYFGPISRSRIEYLRGVNSTFILRSLLMRGLVERVPDPANTNAYLYQPSFEMLRHFGLETKEGLPDFGKFRELLKKFEAGGVAQPTAQTLPPQPEASPQSSS